MTALRQRLPAVTKESVSKVWTLCGKFLAWQSSFHGSGAAAAAGGGGQGEEEELMKHEFGHNIVFRVTTAADLGEDSLIHQQQLQNQSQQRKQQQKQQKEERGQQWMDDAMSDYVRSALQADGMFSTLVLSLLFFYGWLDLFCLFRFQKVMCS